MTYGVLPISREIYNLHMALFYICCVIGVLVFGLLIYALVKHRRSEGSEAAHFHKSFCVEIVWTIIPFIILVILAIPAAIVLLKIQNPNTSGLTVKITGYQSKWRYEYVDQGIILKVDQPMVVPVNTKIRLLITSKDVISVWWVPELGVKQEASPGYISENWLYSNKTGAYRGQCDELCGVTPGFMPIIVNVVSQADFVKWVMGNQKAKH